MTGLPNDPSCVERTEMQTCCAPAYSEAFVDNCYYPVRLRPG